MRLLVDGYNLLHADKPAMFAGLHELSLCAAIARAGWGRGDSAVATRDGMPDAPAWVVCDGSPKPHAPAGEHAPGVELVYSGSAASADDVIIRRLERHDAPRRLTVVSDDRAIQRAAARRRAAAWGCARFLATLARQLGPGGNRRAAQRAPRPAVGALPADQVAAWLSRFGFDEDGREQPRADRPDRAMPAVDDALAGLTPELLESIDWEKLLGPRG